MPQKQLSAVNILNISVTGYVGITGQPPQAEAFTRLDAQTNHHSVSRHNF